MLCSWHENGIYDMPAFIDLIIEKTGMPKIFYVGYSMGATAYFIGLDMIPQLNDKLLAGILLAPGGFLGRSTNPLRLLSALSTLKATDVNSNQSISSIYTCKYFLNFNILILLYFLRSI